MSYDLLDFILIFNDYSRKEEEFLKLLSRWSDRVTISKDRDYPITLKSVSEPVQHTRFGLNVGPITYVVSGETTVHHTSGLRFYVDTWNGNNENLELFHDIFLTACRELHPLLGTAELTEYRDTRPCMDNAEYYKDPYMFCVEPPMFGPTGFGQSNHDAVIAFLNDGKTLSKLDEIRRVMSKSQLVEIIRQHVEKIVEGEDGGIGVLKGVGVQACYPRYFIRQELQRRGVQLPEGLAEKYAAEFGIK